MSKLMKVFIDTINAYFNSEEESLEKVIKDLYNLLSDEERYAIDTICSGRLHDLIS